jgi:mRNA interferase MazF
MQRGDIYELRLPKGIGHEQRGRRLGVVVQSDALLPRSVVVVAPTSTSARGASFRPELNVNGQLARILVEQLGAVDVNRLGDRVGRVAVEQQWQIDAALLTVLGLD